MKILSTENFGLNRLKVCVYGPSGSGKTSLAKTLPAEKSLIVSAEAGLLPLSGLKIDVADITQTDEGKSIPKEKRIERLAEIFKFLGTPEAQKKYEWVFIDSLTEISENLVEALQQEFTEGKDALKMWGEYSKRMRSLIKGFRDMAQYHVVMTALAAPSKSDATKLVVDINGKISTRIPQYFDEVFYAELVENKEGRKVGTLRTASNEKVFAKDRSSTLDAIETADLGLILKKIQGRGGLAK